MSFSLGRRYAADQRDTDHPMRKALAVGLTLPSYKFWTPGAVLDQGETSSCVGHAWEGWLLSSPVRTKNGPSAFTIYDEAKKVDEWPGVSYEGTSVRAGVKFLATQGRVGEYLWAEDLDSLKRWVLTNGPVVLGTNWTESMFTADSKGYVWDTGSVVGGHAYLVVGFSTSRHAFRCLNSWGVGWSQKGRFWMREDVVARLLASQGEACAAIEVSV